MSENLPENDMEIKYFMTFSNSGHHLATFASVTHTGVDSPAAGRYFQWGGEWHEIDAERLEDKIGDSDYMSGHVTVESMEEWAPEALAMPIPVDGLYDQHVPVPTAKSPDPSQEN